VCVSRKRKLVAHRNFPVREFIPDEAWERELCLCVEQAISRRVRDALLVVRVLRFQLLTTTVLEYFLHL
jgi:hypothetical protein